MARPMRSHVCSFQFGELTSRNSSLVRWGRVTHRHGTKLIHHWFRWWLVAWSVPRCVFFWYGIKSSILPGNCKILKYIQLMIFCSINGWSPNTETIMMTSSNGKIFRVTGHLCGEVPGEFPAQRPVTRSSDVFFDRRPNNRLSEQWWGWWFETLSSPLWRHCNGWSKHIRHMASLDSNKLTQGYW